MLYTHTHTSGPRSFECFCIYKYYEKKKNKNIFVVFFSLCMAIQQIETLVGLDGVRWWLRFIVYYVYITYIYINVCATVYIRGAGVCGAKDCAETFVDGVAARRGAAVASAVVCGGVQ